MSYQGIITDANGNTLSDATITLGIELQDQTTNVKVYEGKAEAVVRNGVFDATLGPFPDSLSFSQAYNLFVTYNGSRLGPTPLQAVPYALNATNGVPIGTVVAYFGEVGSGVPAPEGWLLCNGTTFNIEDYPLLSRHLTRLGFPENNRVPDLRGMFLRGANAGRVGEFSDPDARAASPVGSANQRIGSVQKHATAMPRSEPFVTNETGTHEHPYERPTITVDNDAGSFPSQVSIEQSTQVGYTGLAGAHSHTIIRGGDNETRPNNTYVNWIIRAR